MNKINSIILLFISFYGSAQINEPFDKAYSLFNEMKFEEAIKYFDKSIKEYPNHGDSYYFKGLAYGRLGELKNALTWVNKAIKINPQDGAYYGDRGVIYGYMGDHEKALDDFIYAAKYDSLNSSRHFNIAAYYLNKGDCENSIQYLKSCLAVNPKHLIARFKLGICFIQNSEKRMAIKEFTYLINNFEDQNNALRTYDYQSLLAMTLYFRGGLYGEINMYDSSVIDLKRSVEIDDQDPEILNSLGYYMIKIDKAQEALTYLNKSIKISEYPKNLNSRSYAYIQLKQFLNARKDAERAIELDSNDPESYFNLALINNEENNIVMACEAKAKAIKLGTRKKEELDSIICE